MSHTVTRSPHSHHTILLYCWQQVHLPVVPSAEFYGSILNKNKPNSTAQYIYYSVCKGKLGQQLERAP